MKNLYFEKPKQVMFADPESPGEWLIGIAHYDEIICACCGGVFSIDEVVETAAEDGVVNAIYPYEDWIDIAYEISGGEMPEGLTVVEDKIIETAKLESEYIQMMIEDEESQEEEAIAYEAHYFANLE